MDSHLGFQGLFVNYYVTLCAAFSALGGLVFGYEYVSTALTQIELLENEITHTA